MLNLHYLSINSETNQDDSEAKKLSLYEKYIPRYVKQRVISQIQTSEEGKNTIHEGSEETFAALVFADISGFTRLASKLSAEELKYHINEYFTTVLKIVGAHDGDIVKFCGDAILIMWSVPVTAHAGEKRAATIRAALCALQLIDDCGSYSKAVDPKNSLNSSHTMLIQTLSNIFTDSAAATPQPHFPLELEDRKTSQKNIQVELSLHCGVACGKVNCVIVGNELRREFLIGGEVLSEVSLAASIAKKNEVCIHNSCSNYLKKHFQLKIATVVEPKSIDRSLPSRKITLKTHFEQNPDSVRYFGNVTTSQDKIDEEDNDCLTEESSSKEERKQDQNQQCDEIFYFNGEFSEEFTQFLISKNLLIHPVLPNNARASFGCKTPRPWSMRAQLTASTAVFMHSGNEMADLPCAGDDTVCANEYTKGLQKGRRNVSFTSTLSDISSRFMNSIPDLRSSINLGVGVGVGGNGTISESSRRRHSSQSGVLRKIASSFLSRNGNFSVEQIQSMLTRSSDPTVAKIFEPSEPLSSYVNEQRQRLTSNEQKQYQTMIRSFLHETALKAIDCNTFALLSEMRDVVTVFMTIDGMERAFLEGDIAKLQAVFLSILHQLRANGGSLRQFVIDDKGCVVIVCFGLYGSSNSNNCIQAIKFTLLLSEALRGQHGCAVSVGITSGVVYCGNVGSEHRCEFAVMGASVNLAARLMAAASQNQQPLYVDAEVRNNIMNKFQCQQTISIAAKGYDHPIQVYTVITPSLLRSRQTNDRHHFFLSASSKMTDLERRSSDTQMQDIGINPEQELSTEEEEPVLYFSQEIEKQIVEITDMIIEPDFLLFSRQFASVVVVGADGSGKSTFLNRIIRNIKDADLSRKGKNIRSLLVPLKTASVDSGPLASILAGAASSPYFGVKQIISTFLAMDHDYYEGANWKEQVNDYDDPMMINELLDNSGKSLFPQTKHQIVLSAREPSFAELNESTASNHCPTTPPNTATMLTNQQSHHHPPVIEPPHLSWINRQLSFQITLEDIVGFCYGFHSKERIDQLLSNFDHVFCLHNKDGRKEPDSSSNEPIVDTRMQRITKDSSLLELLSFVMRVEKSDLSSVVTAEDLLRLLCEARLFVNPITDIVFQMIVQMLLGYSPTLSLALQAKIVLSEQDEDKEDDDKHWRVDHNFVDPSAREERDPFSLTLLLDDMEECDVESVRIIYFIVDWVTDMKRYGMSGGLIVSTWLESKDDCLSPTAASASKDSSTISATPTIGAMASRFLFQLMQSQDRRKNSKQQQRHRLLREYMLCIKYFSVAIQLDHYSTGSVRSLLYKNLGPKRWEWLLQKHEVSDHLPMFGRRRSVLDAPLTVGMGVSRRNSSGAFSVLPKINEANYKHGGNGKNNDNNKSDLIYSRRKGSELIVDKVYENTNGLPSLVYELIASLKNSIDHGTYQTLHDLPVLKQQNHMKTLELLDSLNGSELAIVKAASVIGNTFPVSLLCEGLISLNMDYCCADLILKSALHRLEKIGVIRQSSSQQLALPLPSSSSYHGPVRAVPQQTIDSLSNDSEEIYTFIEDAVRLSIYNLLLESQRAAIHAAIANYFEDHHCITKDQIDTRTVYQHYMKSGLTDKMTEYSYRMMEEAQNCRSYYEAIQHCSTFIGLAAGLSTKVILKTILDECMEQYYHHRRTGKEVKGVAHGIVPVKRILRLQKSKRISEGGGGGCLGCLPSSSSLGVANMSLFEKRNPVELFDSLIEISTQPVMLMKASLGEGDGQASFASSHVIKRRSERFSLSAAIRSSLPFSAANHYHFQRSHVASSGTALYSATNDTGDLNQSLHRFYPTYSAEFPASPKSQSVYLKNGAQTVKLTGQKMTISYRNLLSRVYHSNIFQEYYHDSLQSDSKVFKSLLGWNSATIMPASAPSDSYSKKILQISNLSHVLLGMERMSCLYFYLGHCGKAEDYSAAALCLLKSFVLSKPPVASSVISRPSGTTPRATQTKQQQQQQQQRQQLRRRSSSSFSLNGRRSVDRVPASVRSSHGQTYQRLLHHRRGSSVNCLYLEIEKRCLRNLGLFTCLRGDLLAGLTLFQQYRRDKQSFATTQPVNREDHVIMLAIESYFYRLSNDYLSSLSCIQQMILSRADDSAGHIALTIETEYHFTTELKGLLYFFMGCHSLCDGQYTMSYQMLEFAYHCYEIVQNYSMKTVTLVLIGWNKVYLQEEKETIEQWMLSYPFLSSSSSSSSSFSSSVNGSAVASAFRSSTAVGNNNKERANQKKKEDDTIPKPFQSDVFMLQAVIASNHRVEQYRTQANGPSCAPPYTDQQVREMQYSRTLSEEKSVISTNYLTGFTGNPYWALRVQQLWEISICLADQLRLVQTTEWKDLFTEYFQSDLLDKTSHSTCLTGKAKKRDKVIRAINQLLEKSFSQDQLEEAVLNHRDHTEEGIEEQTAAVSPSFSPMHATSPLQVMNFLSLCYSCTIHLKSVLNSTDLQQQSERDVAELMIYLWISMGHVSELQEMTFPAIQPQVRLFLSEFKFLMLHYYPTTAAERFRDRTEQLFSYLDRNCFPIFSLYSRGTKASPSLRRKEQLKQLEMEVKQYHLQMTEQSSCGTTRLPSSSPSQYVSILSELYHNFLELHCMKNDSIAISQHSAKTRPGSEKLTLLHPKKKTSPYIVHLFENMLQNLRQHI